MKSVAEGGCRGGARNRMMNHGDELGEMQSKLGDGMAAQAQDKARLVPATCCERARLKAGENVC